MLERNSKKRKKNGKKSKKMTTKLRKFNMLYVLIPWDKTGNILRDKNSSLSEQFKSSEIDGRCSRLRI